MVVPKLISRMAMSYNNHCHRHLASFSHSSSPRCLSPFLPKDISSIRRKRPTLLSPSSSRFFSSGNENKRAVLGEQDPSMLKSIFKERLQEERAKSLLGGGQDRIDRQHAKGSLTARERLDLLFDEGTFQELDAFKVHRCKEFGMDDETKQFPGDGVITGHGRVNGRYVYAFSQGVCVCVCVRARYLGMTIQLLD